MYRRLTRSSLLAIVFALAACKTIELQPMPPVDASLPLSEYGVVLLQVADTTPMGRHYKINHVQFEPKVRPEGNNAPFPAVKPVPAEGDSSGLFVASLPPNTYSIRALYTYYVRGQYYLSQNYPAGIELGTFEVKPGEVTDLGIVSTYIRRAGEEYLYETVRAMQPGRTASWLAANKPALWNSLKNTDQPNSWVADGLDLDREVNYRNAVNRQVTFGLPSIDSREGRMRYPGHLGTILTREGPGDWSLEAFDDDVAIRFLRELDERVILVTEFNEIFSRGNNSEDWKRLSGPPVAGQLSFIDAHPSGGLLAVTQSAETVSVWVQSEGDTDWRELNSIEPKLSLLQKLDSGTMPYTIELLGSIYARAGDRILLAMQDHLYEFDLRTNEFSRSDAPSPESVQSRNGFITIDSRSTFSSNKVSFDQGESWQGYGGAIRWPSKDGRKKGKLANNTERARLQGHPIFLDRSRAYAIHKRSGKSGEPFLVSTVDGGKNWSWEGKGRLPEDCANLVLASEAELLLHCFLSGEFYVSTNKGKSWRVDREVSER